KAGLRAWDATTGKPLGHPIPIVHPLQSVKTSRDASRLLTVDALGVLSVWGVEGERTLFRLVWPETPEQGPAVHEVRVQGPCSPKVDLSPDGRRVAVFIGGRPEGGTHVFEVDSGKRTHFLPSDGVV